MRSPKSVQDGPYQTNQGQATPVSPSWADPILFPSVWVGEGHVGSIFPLQKQVGGHMITWWSPNFPTPVKGWHCGKGFPKVLLSVPMLIQAVLCFPSLLEVHEVYGVCAWRGESHMGVRSSKNIQTLKLSAWLLGTASTDFPTGDGTGGDQQGPLLHLPAGQEDA